MSQAQPTGMGPGYYGLRMMLPALMLLAGMLDWVPARWQSTDPKTLELLSGTPINCLLLNGPLGDPAFARHAAAQGVATLAVLHSGDAPRLATENNAGPRPARLVETVRIHTVRGEPGERPDGPAPAGSRRTDSG